MATWRMTLSGFRVPLLCWPFRSPGLWLVLFGHESVFSSRFAMICFLWTGPPGLVCFVRGRRQRAAPDSTFWWAPLLPLRGVARGAWPGSRMRAFPSMRSSIATRLQVNLLWRLVVFMFGYCAIRYSPFIRSLSFSSPRILLPLLLFSTSFLVLNLIIFGVGLVMWAFLQSWVFLGVSWLLGFSLCLLGFVWAIFAHWRWRLRFRLLLKCFFPLCPGLVWPAGLLRSHSRISRCGHIWLFLSRLFFGLRCSWRARAVQAGVSGGRLWFCLRGNPGPNHWSSLAGGLRCYAGSRGNRSWWWHCKSSSLQTQNICFLSCHITKREY